jgi:beta-N-acetylglucosaminidase
MILVTLMTVKGIIVPAWTVVMVALSLFIGLTFVGWFFVRYTIQDRIVDYQNNSMNPQIRQLVTDVKWLREQVEKK